MKNPAALLPKNKWLRGLAVGVLLIAATGIAVKSKAFGGSRPAPVSTFDVGTINIDDSQQVIIVRSNGWLDTKATLEAMEWDGDSWNTVVGPITASLGRSGFSLQHREGDGSSPAGVFKISEAFGSRQAPDRTKLPAPVTGPEDWWVSDPAQPLVVVVKTFTDSGVQEGAAQTLVLPGNSEPRNYFTHFVGFLDGQPVLSVHVNNATDDFWPGVAKRCALYVPSGEQWQLKASLTSSAWADCSRADFWSSRAPLPIQSGDAPAGTDSDAPCH